MITLIYLVLYLMLDADGGICSLHLHGRTTFFAFFLSVGVVVSEFQISKFVYRVSDYFFPLRPFPFRLLKVNIWDSSDFWSIAPVVYRYNLVTSFVATLGVRLPMRVKVPQICSLNRKARDYACTNLDLTADDERDSRTHFARKLKASARRRKKVGQANKQSGPFPSA